MQNHQVQTKTKKIHLKHKFNTLSACSKFKYYKNILYRLFPHLVHQGDFIQVECTNFINFYSEKCFLSKLQRCELRPCKHRTHYKNISYRLFPRYVHQGDLIRIECTNLINFYSEKCFLSMLQSCELRPVSTAHTLPFTSIEVTLSFKYSSLLCKHLVFLIFLSNFHSV